MPEAARIPFPVLDALPCGAHRLVALTDEALYRSCGVRVLFTGREGGASTGVYASLNTASNVGDDLAAVQLNRRRVLEAAGMPDAALVVPRQVHGTEFVSVDDPTQVPAVAARADEGADGVVVRVPETAALLNAADCTLVVIVSPSGRFAVAHAGWRGALAGIAGKAVHALAAGDECAPSAYNAYIGPHICADCFEVGPEVADRFRRAFGEGVVPQPQHVSLTAAVSIDLCRAGVQARRITDADACTACHPDRLFSYRATGGACGRHAACAVWVPARCRDGGEALQKRS